MSSLKLLDESPILVLPSLARDLGLNEAIVLQQLHWALRTDRCVQDDGSRVLHVGLEFWRQQFPWWSESTIRRAFQVLKDAGLVSVRRVQNGSAYAIDYAAVSVKLNGPTVQDDAGPVQDERSYVERDGEKKERVGGQAAVAAPLFEVQPVVSPPALDAERAQEDEVWDHYFRRFGDQLRVKEFTDARRKLVRKALTAVSRDTDVLKRAIDGLMAYRAAHPTGSRDVSLDALFKTRPGGSNLTDQIEFWASHTNSQHAISAEVPTVLRDRIQRRRVLVAEMLSQPDNRQRQHLGQLALAWLREHAREEPVIEDNRITGWRKVA